MKQLTDEVVHFFERQNYTIVTTVDKDGSPHNACKGIVEIDKCGRLYLLDLYKAETYGNLKQNNLISITAVDEHRFRGYSLKGTARRLDREKLKPHTIKAWDAKISSRITHRILQNISGTKGHPAHPEALLPNPEYLIEVEVKEVISLSPPKLKH